METSELIQQAGRGDVAAFETLTRHLEEPVYQAQYAATQDADVALELTLKTYERAWNGIGLFQDGDSLERWLMHIALDTCQERLRRDRRSRKTPRPSDAELAALFDHPPQDGPTPPKGLHGAIVRRIQGQSGKFHLRALLKRGKFTWMALAVAVVLMLCVRLFGAGATEPGTVSPTPATPTPLISAALRPADPKADPYRQALAAQGCQGTAYVLSGITDAELREHLQTPEVLDLGQGLTAYVVEPRQALEIAGMEGVKILSSFQIGQGTAQSYLLLREE